MTATPLCCKLGSMSKFSCIFFCLLIVGCSHKNAAPEQGQKPLRYKECVEQQEALRKERYASMPDFLKNITGLHRVEKHYDQRPKNPAQDAKELEKESATFNVRKKDSADLRLLDKEPRRTRLNVHFAMVQGFPYSEKKEPTLMFVMAYGQPAVEYYIPASALYSKNNQITGRFRGTGMVTDPRSLDEDIKIKRDLDIEVLIKPAGDEYMYFEWVNRTFKPKMDSSDFRQFAGLAYMNSEDRYVDTESPYYDKKGELSPDKCAPLED